MIKVLVVLLLGIALVISGFIIDNLFSNKVPFVIRRFVPLLCYVFGGGTVLGVY